MVYKRNALDTGLTPECSSRLGVSQRATTTMSGLQAGFCLGGVFLDGQWIYYITKHG